MSKGRHDALKEFKDIECKVCDEKNDPITLEDFKPSDVLFMYMTQNGKKCMCYILKALYMWVFLTEDPNVGINDVVNPKDPINGENLSYDTLVRLHKEYKEKFGKDYEDQEFTQKDIDEVKSGIASMIDKVNEIARDEGITWSPRQVIDKAIEEYLQTIDDDVDLEIINEEKANMYRGIVAHLQTTVYA